MKASDVMTPNVVSVAPGTSVPEIAALLLERRISAVAVLDPSGGVAGVVTQGVPIDDRAMCALRVPGRQV